MGSWLDFSVSHRQSALRGKSTLFVLQGVTKEPLHDVIVGTVPLLLIQFLMIALLYFWPDIALFLPRTVMGR